jgi:hypothetical protein
LTSQTDFTLDFLANLSLKAMDKDLVMPIKFGEIPELGSEKERNYIAYLQTYIVGLVTVNGQNIELTPLGKEYVNFIGDNV